MPVLPNGLIRTINSARRFCRATPICLLCAPSDYAAAAACPHTARKIGVMPHGKQEPSVLRAIDAPCAQPDKRRRWRITAPRFMRMLICVHRHTPRCFSMKTRATRFTRRRVPVTDNIQ